MAKMKKTKQHVRFLCEAIHRSVWKAALLIGLCWGLAGCADGIRSPSPEQLADFEQAGPGVPVMDLSRIARARPQTGPYRVVPGDVLQLEMPAHLFPDALGPQAAAGSKTTQNCRVDDSGAITLPDGRQIAVKGQSLSEVESAVADTYYPSMVKTRPAIYAQVTTYATASVRVMGGVNRPGIYHLRHDQMSLVGALMEAGEVVEGGAATIRIVRSGSVDDQTRFPEQGDSRQSARDMSNPRRPVRLLSVTTPEDQDASMAGLSVRFRKEGPLRTTGRLTITNGSEVLLSQWLDIGIQGQRRAALLAADSKSGRLPIGQLDARLSRLAQLMDSQAPGEEPDRGSVRQTDWTAAPAGVFVASLEGTAESSIQKVRPTGGLKKLVYESSDAPHAAAENEVTLNLPVRGLNIPFADVPLTDGDSIIVERVKPQTVSVIGLVARPGSFPYPPNVHYTLAEALALAGGLDMVAEPHYVSVYRLRTDGTIAAATFQFTSNSKQEHLTEALALRIKPGDVISIEHTLRTRTNVFFDRVVRITLGWYLQPEEYWK
jgi:protein involved in polysaccharide export with SLBB domain